MKVLRVLIAEAFRIGFGSLFVLTLTIILLHVLGAEPSERYLLQLIKYATLSSCAWLMVLWHFLPDKKHAMASGFAVLFAVTTFLPFGPISVERSVTFFLLRSMNNSKEQSFTTEGLQHTLEADYLCGQGAIEKRLNEQRLSDNLAKGEHGAYTITPSGRLTARLVDWLSIAFMVPVSPRSETPFCRKATEHKG